MVRKFEIMDQNKSPRLFKYFSNDRKALFKQTLKYPQSYTTYKPKNKWNDSQFIWNLNQWLHKTIANISSKRDINDRGKPGYFLEADCSWQWWSWLVGQGFYKKFKIQNAWKFYFICKARARWYKDIAKVS